jgi:thioredoxin 1
VKPNQLAKVAALVCVVAAVVVIVLVKRAESESAVEAQPVSASNPVAINQPSVPESESPSVEPIGASQPVDSTTTDQSAAPAQLPKLIDLGADKCIPCKKMAPILEALREDFAGQFEVVFIDVWKNRQAAGPYGIKLIPTQIFFDADGNELFRHEGFFSREDILGKWSELGYAFSVPTGDEDAG